MNKDRLLDLSQIESIIGYTFQDKALLKKCFIHSSYTNEHKGEESNERLEFLGDAVLELVFSEKLYFEADDEGIMTDKRQRSVSDAVLENCVKKMGLEEFLLYSGNQVNVGKKAIPSLLEALVAGIYLDGGYEEAKKFVLANVVRDESRINYVGKLQEYAQAFGAALPRYECLDVEGEDNAPTFTFRVSACGKSATATGKSKKEARMQAASALYHEIIK